MAEFLIDHDYHIHSYISPCSGDPGQTPAYIAKYAADHGITDICLTDHFWDERARSRRDLGFYRDQTVARISEALPLPQQPGVRFSFGCEADLDRDMVLGMTPEHYDTFDFINVAISHLHFPGLTADEVDYASEECIADLWVRRFEAVLESDLPHKKVGFAHITCILMPQEANLDETKIIDLIPDSVYRELFRRAAALGAGIELNHDAFTPNDEKMLHMLRPYRIAKESGCRFFLGSDAHGRDEFYPEGRAFRRAVALLGLTDADRYRIPEHHS